MTKRQGNFRPVQPLQDRKIFLYTNLDSSDSHSAANMVEFKYFLLFVSLLLLCFFVVR